MTARPATPLDIAQAVRQSVADFEAEAHGILGRHEAAVKSRVISVDQTRRRLQSLSPLQQELLTEALSCIEHGLFRAAHVSAWQAFMDNLEEKLASDGLVKVKANHPGWMKFASMEDIREAITEHQIIEAAKTVKLLLKAEMKSLHGLLSTRNQCAHPSAYRPGLNQSLGYVTELVDMMERLQTKSL